MAQQIINLGTTANDGTGDSGRVGGDKVNDNFNEVYHQAGMLWDSTRAYLANDFAKVNSTVYIAQASSTNIDPTTDADYSHWKPANLAELQTYNNTTSGATATNLQTGLDEAFNEIDGKVDLSDETYYQKDNILGTVSATGTYPNLVPTGAIMESGSNSNGSYVKFADGTMICRRAHERTGSVDFSSNGVFVAAVTNLMFPATFVSTPQKNASVFGSALWANINSVGENFNYALLSVTSRTEVTSTAYLIAIGRWK